MSACGREAICGVYVERTDAESRQTKDATNIRTFDYECTINHTQVLYAIHGRNTDRARQDVGCPLPTAAAWDDALNDMGSVLDDLTDLSVRDLKLTAKIHLGPLASLLGRHCLSECLTKPGPTLPMRLRSIHLSNLMDPVGTGIGITSLFSAIYGYYTTLGLRDFDSPLFPWEAKWVPRVDTSNQSDAGLKDLCLLDCDLSAASADILCSTMAASSILYGLRALTVGGPSMYLAACPAFGVSVLTRTKQLRDLEIMNTTVTRNTFRYLPSDLRTLRVIGIRFYADEKAEDVWSVLFDSIRNMLDLELLDLAGNEFTPELILKLCKVVPEALLYLNLSRTNLDDVGACCVANLCQLHPRMSVDVANTKVTRFGASAIRVARFVRGMAQPDEHGTVSVSKLCSRATFADSPTTGHREGGDGVWVERLSALMSDITQYAQSSADVIDGCVYADERGRAKRLETDGCVDAILDLPESTYSPQVAPRVTGDTVRVCSLVPTAAMANGNSRYDGMVSDESIDDIDTDPPGPNTSLNSNLDGERHE